MDAIGFKRTQACLAPAVPGNESAELRVVWARHLDEVREAQRLRYAVFAGEMGAFLRPPIGTAHDLDIDEFDDHCEHLLVQTAATVDEPARVVGTYRVMLPQAARRAGRYYTESEFDLTPVRPLMPRMAELGRSCIAAPWRTGGVILMLWSQLLKFLIANRVEFAVGCASLPMKDGGRHAARLWLDLQQGHLGPSAWRVQPHVPLPVNQLTSDGPIEYPPLVKGYLRCGAWVMGPPAWDADFGTADLPMLLDMRSLPESYRRRFARPDA